MINNLKNNIVKSLQENIKWYILIVAIFISGAVLSKIVNFSANNEVEMNLYLGDFVSNVKNYTTDSLKTFRNSMMGYLKFVGFLFLMSLCALGYIGIFLAIFVKGFFYGSVLSTLFELSFLKGVCFFLSAVLPHCIVVMPCCMLYSIVCAKNAINVSLGVKDIKRKIIKLFLTGIISILVLSTGALIQAYLEPVFIRLIDVF